MDLGLDSIVDSVVDIGKELLPAAGMAAGFYFGGPIFAAGPSGPIMGAIAGFGAGGLLKGLLGGSGGTDSQPATSPTYSNPNNYIPNTVAEGVAIARCYGRCKLGGNKLRFNETTDVDLRIIVAHCLGTINGVATYFVNNVEWGELTNEATHTKTFYEGNRTQTSDSRFTDDRPSGYRSIAYTAFTFTKDTQVGVDPNIVCILNGIECVPLAGGSAAFTRNPAVILYDWYKNVEGYADADLNMDAFESLEALCDTNPTTAEYTSVYPFFDTDSVKATSYYNASYYPYFSCHPSKNLVGLTAKQAWESAYHTAANQRFHIDLGVAEVVKRIYYENGHDTGRSVSLGAKNFTFWGSNTAGSFAELTYATDTGWTQIGGSLQFASHAESNQPDPKYFDMSANTTAYRYYAFKIADNWGGTEISIRRLELQVYTPKYRFDYNFDVSDETINDAKKKIWQSFSGRVVMSQGKLKPVWDGDQVEDGSGGLTTRAVVHSFTEDNIIVGSLTWALPERPNLIRITFLDSTHSYQRSTIEKKDRQDISDNGEVIYSEECLFITDPNIAKQRCKFIFNKLRYMDYTCTLSAFSDSCKVELYDLVDVTHSLPGWTDKQFLVAEKSETAYGITTFTLTSYYAYT